MPLGSRSGPRSTIAASLWPSQRADREWHGDVATQSDYRCSGTGDFHAQRAEGDSGAGEAASGPRAARRAACELDVRGARENRRQRADSATQRSGGERVEEPEEKSQQQAQEQSQQQSQEQSPQQGRAQKEHTQQQGRLADDVFSQEGSAFVVHVIVDRVT